MLKFVLIEYVFFYSKNKLNSNETKKGYKSTCADFTLKKYVKCKYDNYYFQTNSGRLVSFFA